MYLSKKMVVKSIKKIEELKGDLEIAFDNHDIDFNENTGRRNSVLSALQEKSLAVELGKKYNNVVSDGLPGRPDIMIGELDKELECKMSSGTGKVYRSYSLNTDWETIQKKKELDYVYLLTDKAMENYCVLFFDGLTSDDFIKPSTGARGKAKMNKSKAFKKATPIIGSFFDKNLEHIKKLKKEIKSIKEKSLDDVTVIKESLMNSMTEKSIVKNIMRIQKVIDKSNLRVEKVNTKIEQYKDKDSMFKLVFAPLVRKK